MSIYVLIPLPTLKGGGKRVGHLKPCLFHRPATDPAGWTTARLSDGDGMTYKYNDIFWIFLHNRLLAHLCTFSVKRINFFVHSESGT